MLDQKDVDIDRTRYNMDVFLSAYLAVCCRVGQSREPKVTTSFSLILLITVDIGPEAEQMLIQEEAQEEFIYLHKLFVMGCVAIKHSFKPEISERSKKVFYDRSISGCSVYVTAERNNISEDLVLQQSSKALIQFSSSLELLEFR